MENSSQSIPNYRSPECGGRPAIESDRQCLGLGDLSKKLRDDGAFLVAVVVGKTHLLDPCGIEALNESHAFGSRPFAQISHLHRCRAYTFQAHGAEVDEGFVA